MQLNSVMAPATAVPMVAATPFQYGNNETTTQGPAPARGEPKTTDAGMALHSHT